MNYEAQKILKVAFHHNETSKIIMGKPVQVLYYRVLKKKIVKSLDSYQYNTF